MANKGDWYSDEEVRQNKWMDRFWALVWGVPITAIIIHFTHLWFGWF